MLLRAHTTSGLWVRVSLQIIVNTCLVTKLGCRHAKYRHTATGSSPSAQQPPVGSPSPSFLAITGSIARWVTTTTSLDLRSGPVWVTGLPPIKIARHVNTSPFHIPSPGPLPSPRRLRLISGWAAVSRRSLLHAAHRPVAHWSVSSISLMPPWRRVTFFFLVISFAWMNAVCMAGGGRQKVVACDRRRYVRREEETVCTKSQNANQQMESNECREMHKQTKWHNHHRGTPNVGAQQCRVNRTTTNNKSDWIVLPHRTPMNNQQCTTPIKWLSTN